MQWFENWFNTKYYHLLYAHRDENEAALFIESIISKLGIMEDHHVTDLACGKGRHALQLSKQSHAYVTGLDISEASIEFASQYSNEKLQFMQQDMRNIWAVRTEDFVLNLFTSFGYFDHTYQNIKALKSIHKALKPSGVLLIDFLNIGLLSKLYSSREKMEIQRENILFKTEKFIESDIIYKNIEVQDGDKIFNFQEKVQALTYDKFSEMLEDTGFEILEVAGDFQFNKFDIDNSPRLILIARKK